MGPSQIYYRYVNVLCLHKTVLTDADLLSFFVSDRYISYQTITFHFIWDFYDVFGSSFKALQDTAFL